MSVTLPKDVLTLVFSFLGKSDHLNVLCVCRHWHDVALKRVWSPWLNGGCGLFFACERGFVEYYTKWALVAGQRWNPGVARCLGQPNGAGLQDYMPCLTVAAENGHAAIVAHLLADPRVDPNCLNVDTLFGEMRFSGALLAACTAGHLEAVKVLLADSRVVVHEFFVLRRAVALGHSSVV